MNNITIKDEDEFKRQKEKYIYDSNKYIEAKFLVGSGDTVPISELHGENVNVEDVARLLCAITNQIAYIAEICPEAVIIANQMVSHNLKDIHEIKKGDKENDNV